MTELSDNTNWQNATEIVMSSALNPKFLEIENLPPIWGGKIFSSLSDLHVAHIKLASAKRDIVEDTTLTEDGRLVLLDTLFNERVAPAAAKVEADLAALQDEAVNLYNAYNEYLAPANTPSGIAVESEIRSALLRMSDGDRISALKDAIEKGERSVVAALTGPSFLHGFSQDDVKAWQSAYISSHCAELRDAKEALRLASVRGEQTKGALGELRSKFFTGREQSDLEKALAKKSRVANHLE